MKHYFQKFKIYIAVLFLGILWGSTWLAIKLGLEDAPPFTAAAARFILSFLVLIIWLIIKKHKFPKNISYWMQSGFIAIFMFVIPYALVYWGEQYISSGLSSVLFSTQSLFVVIFAHFMTKNEKANFQKIIGLSIGLIGLYLIFKDQINPDETLGLIGLICLLISAASSAFALVILSKRKKEVDPVPEVTIHIGITAFAMIIMALILETPSIEMFSAKLISSIVYLAVLGTVIGFIIYYWIAKHASAVLTSFSVFISPVFAVFLGWLVLKETLNETAFIGVVLVIASILITLFKKVK